MGEAVDALVTSGKHMGQVACRVMYRLAHHADMLYAGIQAQKHSPEWNTAQAVIRQKRQQVHTLQHMHRHKPYVLSQLTAGWDAAWEVAMLASVMINNAIALT